MIAVKQDEKNQDKNTYCEYLGALKYTMLQIKLTWNDDTKQM